MHHIIRLKRYEQPPEGYFEDFLREFNYRQRAELLKPSLSAMIMERLTSLMSEIRVPAMAYAGAALVAVGVGTAIIKALDQKQWQITNIVKLRVAGMEDASV